MHIYWLSPGADLVIPETSQGMTPAVLFHVGAKQNPRGLIRGGVRFLTESKEELLQGPVRVSNTERDTGSN